MDETQRAHRETGLYGQRKSRSADTARELHIERTWALDPIERIRLSLSLGRRLRRLADRSVAARARG